MRSPWDAASRVFADDDTRVKVLVHLGNEQLWRLLAAPQLLRRRSRGAVVGFDRRPRLELLQLAGD
jgi:hypothetical protein